MAANLIREARKRASISQRELALRLGTHQPTIARWENGTTRPDFVDVERVIAACGFDLTVSLTPRDEHDLALIRRELKLLPHERLSSMVGAVNRLVQMSDAGR